MNSTPLKPTSPTGWWIAALLQRNPPGDSSAYWNNYRLIRAGHWREAFRRAEEFGENNARVGNEAFGAGHEFLGVTDLVPVHDEFKDGAELLFEGLEGAEDDPSEPPLDVWTEDELADVYNENASPPAA